MLGSGCSFWPTPTASDAGYFPDMVIAEGSVSMSGPTDVSEGSGGQYSIANAARNWTVLFQMLNALGALPRAARSRYSPPVRVSLKHGPNSSSAGLISNPRFYELIMGWPIDWTAPGARVTEFPAWLQRSRGALSEALARAD